MIGGAELFREALPFASRIYLSRVHASPPGDVMFPSIDWSTWRATHTESHPGGLKDAFAFTFSVLERA